MLSPEKVLDLYFLESRCQLIEVAAMLDRYDTACNGNGNGASDPRLEKLYQSLKILANSNGTSDRAEQLLLLFSDPA